MKCESNMGQGLKVKVALLGIQPGDLLCGCSTHNQYHPARCSITISPKVQLLPLDLVTNNGYQNKAKEISKTVMLVILPQTQ